MKFSILVFLASCVHLPHVDPKTRTNTVATYATVRVDSDCGNFPDFPRLFPEDPQLGFDPVESSHATGVIISERHVITAAHVVRCGAIPNVWVTYRAANGKVRKLKMSVTEDDAMFGEGKDIARLEISSAENFEVHLAPPSLGDGWPTSEDQPVWCAFTLGGRRCGEGTKMNNTFETKTHPGDSGSGVYDAAGRLVGIVVRSAGAVTHIEPVEARWLKGT